MLNFEISPPSNKSPWNKSPLEQAPTQKIIFANKPPGAYSRIYGTIKISRRKSGCKDRGSLGTVNNQLVCGAMG